uniref:RecBCD enzyme subunit RecD n=1 Tax=uncultured Thiotrichaceae bacterium TaxID=298394 RepID=A0A6S6SHA9_9GAMM|nr:MAG: Exodeoxyribonuclease V alpha chain (EC [uncultured Thiotrichaceae bacterium]
MAITTDSYNFLDKQLAELLLRLCRDNGHTLSPEQKTQLTTLTRQTSAATRDGIIALPLAEIAEESEESPYIPSDLKALQNLPVVGAAGEYAPLIIEDDHVWLNRYWQYENRLAHALYQRLNTLPLNEKQSASIQARIKDWHYLSGNPADPNSHEGDKQDWQQRAVAMAAYSRFLVISGGPGTGKTTTVIRLLWLLIEQMQVNPQRILLAAPTGKAAMRLQESIRQAKATLDIPQGLSEQIPEQASTLHRLLGFIPGRVGFRHHTHNPLSAEVVIVDEASMIDISLMTHLFEAVSPHARLILLGDKDQLAAVETGSIFRDLCSQANNQYSGTRQQQLDYLCSEKEVADDSFEAQNPPVLNDHIVVLQKSWRFDANSGIGQLAAAVRDGQEKNLKTILTHKWADIEHNDSGSLDMQQLLAVWGDYLQLASQRPNDNDTKKHLRAVFTAFNRFRILTPLRKGSSGAEHLNLKISEFMRKQHTSQYYSTDKQWFIGRPVMVTQNDYRQNLFNGDIGLTLADNSGQLRVWFPDQEGFRAIAPVRLPAYETAWCMTIHKSQGSEFGEVLLILPENEDIPILGRELLYTGITRAKKKIGVLGKLRVIRHAMKKTLPPSSRIYQRLNRYEAED